MLNQLFNLFGMVRKRDDAEFSSMLGDTEREQLGARQQRCMAARPILRLVCFDGFGVTCGFHNLKQRLNTASPTDC